MHEDLFRLIRDDHNRVLTLLQQLETTPAGASGLRQANLQNLIVLLGVHTTSEEDLVYPLLQRSGLDDHSDLSQRGSEEHREVLRLARGLVDADPAVFTARLAALKALIAAHVDDEEMRVFALLRATVPAPLLARQASRWKETRRSVSGSLHQHLPVAWPRGEAGL
jgi:hypothetical protein